MIEIGEAQRRVLDEIPVLGTERIHILEALGRVLAQDVQAKHDVPSGDNSAMDGYALAGADLPPAGSAAFAIVGPSWAGRPYVGDVGHGQCVRIMTGATVPEAKPPQGVLPLAWEAPDFGYYGLRSAWAGQATQRGGHADKDPACRADWTTVAQVVGQGRTDIRWQRQSCQPLSLAAHDDLAAFPIQIVQGHGNHFAAAQTEPGQQ